jgi:3'-5' exoribonuclease
MLNEYSKKVENFPTDLLVELEHILLSHHGEFEWGSPILPKTTEALIIHSADNLDSKVAQFREYTEKAQDGRNEGDESSWSDYNRFLSRRVRVKGVKTNDNED